jgi:hypothetical protein
MPAHALRTVRARIDRGWSQGADARNGEGDAVILTSATAEAWSHLGAIALAATDGVAMNRVGPALRAVGDVTEARSLRDWNDYPNRTQAAVLDALDSGILRIEGDSR